MSKSKVLPPGAIIAKEKRIQGGSGSPDGIAFMVKRDQAEFKDTGGWEFMYFPTGPDKGTTHAHCAACHRNAVSRDYVFGEYPRSGN